MDAFEQYAVAAGPELERVEIGFCGDDALNIHSVMSLLLKVVPASAAASTKPVLQTEHTLYIVDTGIPGAPSFNARHGDVIQIYDIQTVAAKGEGTVQSVSTVSDPAVVSEAAQAMSNVNAQCIGGCGIFNCSGICGFHYVLNRVLEVVVVIHRVEKVDAFGTAQDLQQLRPFDLVQVKGRSADGKTGLLSRPI